MKKREKGESKCPLIRRMRQVRYENTPARRHIPMVLLVSLGVTLLVEGFNQGSVPRMLNYLGTRTGYFLLNWLIIFATMSIAELFKRRTAVLCTVSTFWLSFGFANYMVICDRTQPLLAGDLVVTREIFGLITVYFTPIQIVAIFLGGGLVVAVLLMLYSVTKRREKVNYIRSIAWVAANIIVALCMCTLAVRLGWVTDLTSDRVGAFRRYGFATSFAFTCGSGGISQPEEYSTETVDRILEDIDDVDTTGELEASSGSLRFGAEDDPEHPNVIFLQLESFFDTDTLVDTQFSDDPMPNFHALMAQWPTAELYVPAVGGGTANVEFEVMSGMNMDFFGAGEAPYSTVLMDSTCESIATIMRRHGYAATAMHNNTGAFYSRNVVYANLGYDRFDSLEYMPYPKYTDVGWARDEVLTGEIIRAMDTTESRDMVFAISVESHGKFADSYEYKQGDIEVLAAPEEINLPALQNYVNIIPDVDAFLGELIDALTNYDEPVLLIVYGDHLPSLGLNPEMLTTGDIYASRYIVWNNFGAKYNARSMEAYRLGSEVLRELGITDGVMNRFHQNYAIDEEGEEYLERLKTLEYDLLFGERDAYGEAGAPIKTNLQMGLAPIRISSAESEYGRLLVTGSGYTEYSKVVSGDTAYDTLFVDDRRIVVASDDLKDDTERISVAQINTDGKELSRTGEFTFTNTAGNKGTVADAYD